MRNPSYQGMLVRSLMEELQREKLNLAAPREARAYIWPRWAIALFWQLAVFWAAELVIALGALQCVKQSVPLTQEC
jgi:hypothetical protein